MNDEDLSGMRDGQESGNDVIYVRLSPGKQFQR